MTREEAEKVADVLAEADSGCSNCIRGLCTVINTKDLGYEFTYNGDTGSVDVKELGPLASQPAR